MMNKIVWSFIALGFSGLALAESAAASVSAGVSMMGQQGVLLLALLVVFYFLLMRPQQKKAKEHQNLLANLKKDDEILTSGGIIGKIVRLKDNFLVLSVADGVEMIIQRQAIISVLPKGTLKSI